MELLYNTHRFILLTVILQKKIEKSFSAKTPLDTFAVFMPINVPIIFFYYCFFRVLLFLLFLFIII